MPASTAGKNAMLDAVGAIGLFASLHSAYPGDTGANEITGGTYTREGLTWAAAAGGSMSAATFPTFDVPAAQTIAFVGIWTAATGGTFLGSLTIGGGTAVPFQADDGTDVLTSDAHGFTDGQRVVVFDTEGGVLPTGLVEGTVYFVRDTTADTYKLAATSGGAAIDLTGDGTGFTQAIVPETPGSAAVYTPSALTLSLNR